MSAKEKSSKSLPAQVLTKNGADHSQAQNGDGAMVSLEGHGKVEILGVEVGSPTEAAENA
jgi:hypothetical protein